MKKKMTDFLLENNLYDEDVYLDIQIQSSAFAIENCIEDMVNFPTIDVKFLIGTDAEPTTIGTAQFYFINASHYTDSEIRELADTLDFSLYKAISSVKIYQNISDIFTNVVNLEASKQAKVMLEYSNISHKITNSDIQTGYNLEAELYTFEKNPYSPHTINVHGKILVLDEIMFVDEYNKTFIAEHFTNIMLKQFKFLGLTDFIIVNPNIELEYLKEQNYPASSSVDNYINFWKSFKATPSYGKLHNQEYCLVIQLT